MLSATPPGGKAIMDGKGMIMSTLSHLQIGFIGLGLMGQPMARNLHRAGAKVTVHNRSQAPVKQLESVGLSAAPRASQLARQCPIVILMLTDTPAVEAVLTGGDGVLQGVHSNSMIIDMGTTSVTVTRNLARRAAAAGASYVDAPVSGGVTGASEGSLSIMVGASEHDFNRAEPVLRALGQTITHIGEVGAGQVAKAANQVIVGLNIGALAEALTLVRAAGVDPANVCRALAGGFAASQVLTVHGPRMIDNNFQPGARITTQHKDMRQAIELAHRLGVELPACELNRDLYQSLIDAGDGDLDHSALIRAYSRSGLG